MIWPRSKKRKAAVVGAGLLALAVLGGWYFTRPAWITPLAQSMLGRLTHADATIDHARLSWGGKLILTGVHLRIALDARGERTTQAGRQLFDAKRITLTPDFSAIPGHGFRPKRITVDEPTVHIIENRQTGRYNYQALRLTTGPEKKKLTYLPRVRVKDGQVRFAQVSHGRLKRIGQRPISGRLVRITPEDHARHTDHGNRVDASDQADQPAQDDDAGQTNHVKHANHANHAVKGAHRYRLALRSPRGSGADELRLQGVITLPAKRIKLHLSGFHFDAPQGQLLPQGLRQWWNHLDPSGDLPQVTLNLAPNAKGQMTIDSARVMVKQLALTVPLRFMGLMHQQPARTAKGSAPPANAQADAGTQANDDSQARPWSRIQRHRQAVRQFFGASSSTGLAPAPDRRLQAKARANNAGTRAKAEAEKAGTERPKAASQKLPETRQVKQTPPITRMTQVSGVIEYRHGQINVPRLTGLIEGVRYHVQGRHGLSPAQPFEIEVKTEPFDLSRHPDFYPALPLVVKKMHRLFQPRGTFSAHWTISRAKAGAKVHLTGAVNIIDADATFAKFPYPSREITHGTIAFSDQQVRVINLVGFGPSGTRLVLDGKIAPPGHQARVHFVGEVRDLPIDQNLYHALEPKARKVVKFFFDRGAYQKLLDHGVIRRPSQPATSIKSFVPWFGSTELVPAFKPGGTIKHLRFVINRERGKDKKYRVTISVDAAGLSVLLRAWPYPLKTTGGVIAIGQKNIDLRRVDVRGLSGAVGRISGAIARDPKPSAGAQPAATPGEEAKAEARTAAKARTGAKALDVAQTRSSAGPSLRIEQARLPIDRFLLASLPTTQGRWLEGLNLRGKLRAHGRIYRDPGFNAPESAKNQGEKNRERKAGHGEPSTRGDAESTNRGQAPSSPSSTHHVPINFTLRSTLERGSIDSFNHQYRLANLAGAFTLKRDRLIIHRIRGTHGASQVKAHGQIKFGRPQPKIDFTLDAANLGLQPSIIDVIPPGHRLRKRAAALFRRFKPRGRLDAQLTLKGTGENTPVNAQAQAPADSEPLPQPDQPRSKQIQTSKHSNQPPSRPTSKHPTTATSQATVSVAEASAATSQPAPSDQPLSFSLTTEPHWLSFETRGQRMGLSKMTGLVRLSPKSLELNHLRANFGPRARLDERHTVHGATPARSTSKANAEPPDEAGDHDELADNQSGQSEHAARADPRREPHHRADHASDDDLGRLRITGVLGMDPRPEHALSVEAAAPRIGPVARAILPEQVVNAIDGLHLTGRWHLNPSRLRFRPHSTDKPVFDFEGTVDVNQAKANIGLPVTNLQGKLAVHAREQPGQASPAVKLNLQADHLRIKGRRISPLRVVMSSEAGAQTLDLNHLRGSIYDGALVGQGVVELADPHRYQLNLTLEDARLQPMINQAAAKRYEQLRSLAPLNLGGNGLPLLPKPTAIGDHAAVMSVGLKFASRLGRPKARRGRGNLLIRNADLANRPLSFALMQAINLSLPQSSSFDTVGARFLIDGQSLLFDTLSLESPGVEMTGTGRMALPSMKLDLTMFNRSPGHWMWRPISQLLNTVKDQVTAVHLTGTLMDPDADLVPFKSLRRTWSDLFRDRHAKRPNVPQPIAPEGRAGQ